jgi:hypothetical protein
MGYGGDRRSSVVTALINGEVVNYDMCSENRHAYSDGGWQEHYYLGKGKIHTIDGVKQSRFNNHHFFKFGKKSKEIESITALPKRYNCSEHYSHIYKKDVATMSENKHGKFVKVEDYNALQKELEEMRENHI